MSKTVEEQGSTHSAVQALCDSCADLDTSQLDTSTINTSTVPSDTEDTETVTTDHTQPGAPSMWHQAPVYAAYWHQYRRMWAWFHKHDAYMQGGRGRGSPRDAGVVRSMQQQRMYHLQCAQWYATWERYFHSRPCGRLPRQASPHRHHHQHRPSKKSKRKAKKRQGQHKKIRIERDMSVTTVDSKELGESIVDSDDTEMQMEFTPEMLAFFSQSAKHKEEREAKKQTKNETGDIVKDEYVKLGEETASQHASILPPRERPGVKRTSEMKLLYGRGAAMIHGMETAMQLNYDRNCDRKAPKLWPNLPLSIVFN